MTSCYDVTVKTKKMRTDSKENSSKAVAYVTEQYIGDEILLLGPLALCKHEIGNIQAGAVNPEESPIMNLFLHVLYNAC